MTDRAAAAKDAAMMFEARTTFLKKDTKGVTVSLVLHPDEVPQDLLADLIGSRYFVTLIKIDDDEEPIKGEKKNRADKALRLAGAMAKHPDFQKWLVTKGYAQKLGEEAAAEAIRKCLGIDSRADIPKHEFAVETMFHLRDQFVYDTRGGA